MGKDGIKKISKYEVKPVQDPCGLLRELYSSDHLSIAHDTVVGDAKKHTHKVMEEIYYVEDGEGQLLIDKEILDIKKGDLIPIPKNTVHALKKLKDTELQVLVVTYPKYDPHDLILAE